MKVRVIPNAKSFGVSFEQGLLKARVCAPAEGGRANEELVKKLSKLVGTKISIVRGMKSREKEIVFDKMSEEAAAEKINSLSTHSILRK